MSSQVPSIETISPDIPNPFEVEESASESCSPPNPLRKNDEVTQIHRYTDTQETKET